MAVYTTFFAATPDELDAAFPAWVNPLASPVKRTRINPFTKQPVTYDSWEPDEVFAAATNGQPEPEPRAPSAVTGAGDYEAFLRARLPKGLRDLPHLAGKSVLAPHVQQVLALVACRDEEEDLRPALFPPPTARSSAMLDRLPAWGVEALATIFDAEVSQLGEALAEREGWFLDDGWEVEACAWLDSDVWRRRLGSVKATCTCSPSRRPASHLYFRCLCSSASTAARLFPTRAMASCTCSAVTPSFFTK